MNYQEWASQDGKSTERTHILLTGKQNQNMIVVCKKLFEYVYNYHYI